MQTIVIKYVPGKAVAYTITEAFKAAGINFTVKEAKQIKEFSDIPTSGFDAVVYENIEKASPVTSAMIMLSEIGAEPEEVKESKAQIIKQMAEREGIPVVEMPLANPPDIKDYKGRPTSEVNKLLPISDDQIKKYIEIILKDKYPPNNKAMMILIRAADTQQLFTFFSWFFIDPEEGCVKYAKTEAHVKAIQEATRKIELLPHKLWGDVDKVLTVAYPTNTNIPPDRILEKVLEILEYKAN